MRLYLAQSFPDAWGGVRYTAESMKLYLCTWPEGWGDSANPESKFVSGTVQWESFTELQPMKLRILLSYWYYKDTDLDALFAKYFSEPYPDVFADSGGFSAETQGVHIAPGEYAQWVKRYQHLFSTYANLDVIGNAEATAVNQKRLEDMGLSPIPVFHASGDFAPLEALLDAGYSYIALGGLVPYSMQPKVRMRFCIKAFQLAEGRAVFHGFGVTSWGTMSSLPWYSVDSSSWGQGFRFGQVPLFDRRKGKFFKASLGNARECSKLAHLFRDLGFEWQDFADRKRNDRAKICAVSALSYMYAEQYLRQKFGPIYIPGREGAPAGLRAHLVTADSTSSNMGTAALAQAGFANTTEDASAGIRVHLADARGPNGGDLAAVESGLRLHLAEHSLDRGGVGDTSRAAEMLAGLKLYGAAGNIESDTGGAE